MLRRDPLRAAALVGLAAALCYRSSFEAAEQGFLQRVGIMAKAAPVINETHMYTRLGACFIFLIFFSGRLIATPAPDIRFAAPIRRNARGDQIFANGVKKGSGFVNTLVGNLVLQLSGSFVVGVVIHPFKRFSLFGGVMNGVSVYNSFWTIALAYGILGVCLHESNNLLAEIWLSIELKHHWTKPEGLDWLIDFKEADFWIIPDVNLVMLLTFTVLNAFVFSMIALGMPKKMSRHEIFLFVSGLVTFACNAEDNGVDCSGLVAWCYPAAWILMAVSLCTLFITGPMPADGDIFMSGAGVLVFGAWLVNDVAKLVKTKHESGLDDGMIAAVGIYLNVVNMMLGIIKVLQAIDDKEAEDNTNRTELN